MQNLLQGYIFSTLSLNTSIPKWSKENPEFYLDLDFQIDDFKDEENDDEVNNTVR